MPDEVRDRRQRGWSWFDNSVIDHFGPIIGPYGIALYMVLVRHSDAATQECFPSQSTLAKELHISKQTVWRTIQKLVAVGLIQKRRRRSTSGDWDSTIYTLVDTLAGVVPVGNNPSSLETPVNIEEMQEVVPVGNNVVPQGNDGCSCGEQRVVPVGNTNKTHLNKTQVTRNTTPPENTSYSLTPPEAPDVADPSPAETLVAWWQEHIVPLGGRPFSIDDADDKFLTKANKLIKSKSAPAFWERVKQGFERSSWLKGDIRPDEGKKRFRATLPWFLANHHQKGIANYTLVAAGEWDDQGWSASRPRDAPGRQYDVGDRLPDGTTKGVI